MKALEIGDSRSLIKASLVETNLFYTLLPFYLFFYQFPVVNRQENLDYLETGENPLLLGLVLLCSDRQRRESLLGALVEVASSVLASSCISATVLCRMLLSTAPASHYQP